MTYNLRPAAQRTLTVKQEQLLQAGKRLEGDQQTRTFKNGPKGYTGAALNPWRTAKKVTRPGERYTGQAKRQAVKVVKRNGEWSYPEIGGSQTAVGLSPWKGDWEGHTTTAASESRCDREYRWDDARGYVPIARYQYATPQKNPTSEYYYAKETLDADNCVREEWIPAALTASNGNTSTNAKAIALRAGWERSWYEESVSVEVPNRFGAGTYWKNVSLTGQYDPRTEEPAVVRVEGFEPATTEERDAALAEQIQIHGSGYRARHARQCKAWETKQTSWKQLTNVVRGATSWVSLDDRPEGMEGDEPAWTPTTASDMEALEMADTMRLRQESWNKVLAGLTDKQLEAVVMTAEGETLTGAQRFNLLAARNKVARKVK